jgi:hypothetical protein
MTNNSGDPSARRPLKCPHGRTSAKCPKCWDEGDALNSALRTRTKPLRLRIEPSGPTGPHWLTLLCLCGWLRGVVNVEGMAL